MKQLHWLAAAAGAAAVSFALSIPNVERTHAQGRTSQEYEPPAVFQGAGPTASSVQGLLDQFRLALGANNASNPGPLPAGRREINWDGGGSATSPVPTPFTGFLNSRGALFLTTGSGFVQAPVSGMAATFDNATYATVFQPFSPQRLFSPVGSNITEVQFFIPGGGASAATNGFGAVFNDVDQPDGSGPGGKRGNRGASTLIQYFGTNNELLFSSWVPASPGNGGFSFMAIMFPDARITSVRIMTGDHAAGPDDTPDVDIVMMDDFVYGEPRVPASTSARDRNRHASR
jgi:hypothetical protein